MSGRRISLTSRWAARLALVSGIGAVTVLLLFGGLESLLLILFGANVDNAAQAAGMLRGRRARGLAQLTTQEVIVDADARTIPVGVDGEALTLPTPVHCRIRPRALRVRVPRDRPGVPHARPPMNWRQVRRLARSTFRTAAGRGD